jgi:hypothetical protein
MCDCYWLANISAKFADSEVSSGQRDESATAVKFGFLDRNLYFSFKSLLNYPHEAEWTPFQTHYYSEKLVEPRIEAGTS